MQRLNVQKKAFLQLFWSQGRDMKHHGLWEESWEPAFPKILTPRGRPMNARKVVSGKFPREDTITRFTAIVHVVVFFVLFTGKIRSRLR